MVASSAQVIDSHNLSSEIALIRDVEKDKASYPIDWVAIRLDRKCRGLPTVFIAGDRWQDRGNNG